MFCPNGVYDPEFNVFRIFVSGLFFCVIIMLVTMGIMLSVFIINISQSVRPMPAFVDRVNNAFRSSAFVLFLVTWDSWQLRVVLVSSGCPNALVFFGMQLKMSVV